MVFIVTKELAFVSDGAAVKTREIEGGPCANTCYFWDAVTRQKLRVKSALMPPSHLHEPAQ